MQDSNPKNTASNTLVQGLPSHLGRLPMDWRAAFNTSGAQNSLRQLTLFLNDRLAQQAVIYPREPFRALHAVHPAATKVVILGQDPYHGANQAQGLAFSVPDTCPRPPSLRNILNELAQNYPDQLQSDSHDLTPWTEQGVLLLNAVFTVEAGKAASHANQGWEAISDAVLSYIAREPSPKVFMLWGAYAQRKRELLESQANGPILILTANHPSPLSARRPPKPFLGSGHFRAANDWLEQQGDSPIDWTL